MKIRRLRYERIWTLAGLGFVLLVVWLSLTPDPPSGPKLFDIKAGHLAAYGWLMLWFAQIHPSHRTRAGIAMALCAMGVALEYLQGFITTSRTFSYADMADNALGVIAGLALGTTRLGGALAVAETAFLRLVAPK